MASRLRAASWVLLVVVAGLTLLGSLASAGFALRSDDDQIGSARLSELSGGRADVVTAVMGRRLTSAAYAAGFATLLLFVAVVPYRRGDVWAWWAVLAATLVAALMILARVPFLNTRVGAGTGAVMLGVTALALVLDVGRLRAAPGP
jgi:hypothetical protein